jgi:hypothetical protein
VPVAGATAAPVAATDATPAAAATAAPVTATNATPAPPWYAKATAAPVGKAAARYLRFYLLDNEHPEGRYPRPGDLGLDDNLLTACSIDFRETTGWTLWGMEGHMMRRTA